MRDQVHVVRGPGSSPDQIRIAVRDLLGGSTEPVFVTRASADQYEAVVRSVPEAVYHPRSGLVVVRPSSDPPVGRVAVVSAGTSDLPVAEEAARAGEALALEVTCLPDVGVAGLHRLLDVRSSLEQARCVVAIAGMEGALPSVIAGLVSRPVVAVPTSIGYGSSLGGLAALSAMLSASALGLGVVEVDGGLAAAVLARRILRSGG